MELIYITADPSQAIAVQNAGVDWVMVDLEINGKENRQGHLNTVISRHTLEDVSNVRGVLDQSGLLVRVNPLFEGSSAEVDDVIARGADRIMLPMFKHVKEVEQFLEIVDMRVPVTLLVETAAAFTRLPQILALSGIDDIHFGLNDLHLDLGLSFMFEIFTGNLLDHAAGIATAAGIPFGIGGAAPVGTGLLPSELILSEHARLGSQRVILSRAFRDIVAKENNDIVGAIQDFRKQHALCLDYTPSQIDTARQAFSKAVNTIVLMKH